MNQTENMVELEACVESYSEAEVASQHQLKRIELCSGLDVGGLTPSAGLIEKCAVLPGIETHVLIRPRPGDFQYNAEELTIMKRDIELAAKCGAQGVVFGILDGKVSLNKDANKELLQFSKSFGLEVIFHRAFDVCKEAQKVLDQLIELGFDRLLTSGQAKTAIEGIEVIQNLVSQAKGKIQVMAGSGVNSKNAKELVEVGLDSLHFSIRKSLKQEGLGMGNSYRPDVEKLINIKSVIK